MKIQCFFNEYSMFVYNLKQWIFIDLWILLNNEFSLICKFHWNFIVCYGSSFFHRFKLVKIKQWKFIVCLVVDGVIWTFGLNMPAVSRRESNNQFKFSFKFSWTRITPLDQRAKVSTPPIMTDWTESLLFSVWPKSHLEISKHSSNRDVGSKFEHVAGNKKIFDRRK